MDIYVYSDESGVFDVVHNDYYVYGGVLFLNKNDKDNENRKYINIEKTMKQYNNKFKVKEIKANILTVKEKYKIMKSTNNILKFGVVINQKRINKDIFNHKKSKQRYLDYAYKIGLKECLKKLIKEGKIIPNEIENIYVFVDEHTTATNGKYELEEALLMEFKYGTFNHNYQKSFPPLFNKLKSLTVKYCASEKNPLIRLADITANYIYNGIINKKEIKNICMKYLP